MPPGAAGLAPARFGFDEVPLGGAGFEDEAAEPGFGLAGELDTGGISLLGVGDCCTVGVGLAVVATSFGFEEQADCAINRTAISPVKEKILQNRDLIIKPSGSCEFKFTRGLMMCSCGGYCMVRTTLA